MGDQRVSTSTDGREIRNFTKSVLRDLEALERMLDGGMLEEDKLRIGAEQEMFLVDSAMCPSPVSTKVIEHAEDPRLTTEIGLFNIEANLSPLDLEGKCLSKMEGELKEVIGIVRNSAREFGSDIILTGILPTIAESDLVMENLTPLPRYIELNRILTELQGEDRVIHIKGLDELSLHENDTFIEFCNTSFQVHLQVGISEYANHYNWSQAIAAPVLASAVNSPILLGHRLWMETRIALFKHAVDSRSVTFQARSQPSRVNFGYDWMPDSIIDVIREDVARFRVIITREIGHDSLDMLDEGKIPKLGAWGMLNGTIWRWNRTCYGVMDGKPSLRVEARYLPSGPSVIDEIANSAFFIGLMLQLPKEYGDVRSLMSFDDVKENFFSAARFGFKSQIVWLDQKGYTAQELILNELAPRAREGLKNAGVDQADIDRYMGVIEARANAIRTGAGWMLESLSKMDPQAKRNVKIRAMMAQMKENQEKGDPIYEWDLATIDENTDWIDNYGTVERFMSKDLFTVRPGDVIDLAASLMNWKHIRHVPVEDDSGNLVGVVSHRDLLELLAKSKPTQEVAVHEVMNTDLTTITPETSSLEALSIMRTEKIGCLPVVRGEKLIGLITAHDFLSVSAKLFEERMKSVASGSQME
ncbi:MAG: CBS domain-containing protein [Pyrinomonadaceae bacterium]|nr:CBS domain-containing protein [Pyrinomonadaceae bacterium]